MRTPLTLLFGTVLLMAGCGSFSRDAPAPATPTDARNPLLPESTGIFSSSREEEAVYLGSPVQTVSSVVLERVPGGAIVRARGIAAIQGVYDVRLVPQNVEELPQDGVLTYRLAALHPASGPVGGPEAARQVIAARHLTDSQLQGVRTIRIEGARNAASARR